MQPPRLSNKVAVSAAFRNQSMKISNNFKNNLNNKSNPNSSMNIIQNQSQVMDVDEDEIEDRNNDNHDSKNNSMVYNENRAQVVHSTGTAHLKKENELNNVIDDFNEGGDLEEKKEAAAPLGNINNVNNLHNRLSKHSKSIYTHLDQPLDAIMENEIGDY